MFSVRRSILGDRGTELPAEVVQHLLRWLKAPLDNGPANHARARGAVEKAGGRVHSRSFDRALQILA